MRALSIMTSVMEKANLSNSTANIYLKVFSKMGHKLEKVHDTLMMDKNSLVILKMESSMGLEN